VITFGGILFFFKVDDCGKIINFTSSFPPILSKEFTFEFFIDLIKNQAGKKTVKDFLVTKNRFPGFSNDILHEVLWEAKINPKTKVNMLTTEDYTILYTAIKTVFIAIVDKGAKISTKTCLAIMVDT